MCDSVEIYDTLQCLGDTWSPVAVTFCDVYDASPFDATFDAPFFDAGGFDAGFLD
jgi:hypothetical protein